MLERRERAIETPWRHHTTRSKAKRSLPSKELRELAKLPRMHTLLLRLPLLRLRGLVLPLILASSIPSPTALSSPSTISHPFFTSTSFRNSRNFQTQAL